MSVFDAIADPVRRQILGMLAGGPRRVVDIQRELGPVHPISRPAVSRHLRVLGDAGLVRVTESGRERHYRLDTEPLDEVSGFVAKVAGRHGDLARRGPVGPHMLDALDTEVYRTRRERRTARADHEENTA
ncbi:metalloregulator ArsR/SmtB family transcription factor [Gordonia sp. HNM0687]|uniref:Metalloregulator ArsR/SmtB family transcription factor n=1 Tax=Gordonia mangrovi TaxID=2665643 RepID=A0A6L7GQ39_9ACTN|nr:metalloregulator ArsR/SmtB family transcription factor [Gordonia mangrovi]MXP20658.1 metalloregulator ArsR/SmtB family transcription factor [Gordonia mangrovi]UVF78764.1 metalloregulator ArsR/SmtB family transcription factor [Gordonia mangrovi]